MKAYKYRKDIMIDGIRHTIRADSEKELIEKIIARKQSVEDNSYAVNRSTTTVREWAKLCFEQYKTHLALRTYENQWGHMKKWIIEPLGRMKLKDVKAIHCQGCLNAMHGYSADMIRRTNQQLKWLFDKALQNDLIIKNPAAFLTQPKGHTTKRRSITEDERLHILQVAEKAPEFKFYLAMLFCGCRPSEAAELRGMDIMKINGENILHIRGTKSANADRNVPLPNYLYNRLPKVEPFELLFKNTRGEKMTRNSMRNLWKRFKKQLNISMGCEVYKGQIIPPFRVADDLVPYDLRHTFCTDLQKKGVDIRTAQYLMGHSDISLTANVYTHGDNEVVLAAAKIMNGTE